jgi:hypothetical protein
MVRRLGLAVVAGVGAGVACGLVARLCMRLATLAAGEEGEFSWGGTAGIVVVFIVAALPGAVAAAFMRGRLRWAVAVVFSLLLCVPATGVATADLGSLDGLTTGQRVGALMAAAGVHLAILSIPVVTARLLGALGHEPRGTMRQAGA